jgi:nucleotide-binding universal stress UspA family protein
MRTLHSILVPVDGSDPSLAALDHAVSLAQDYDATIEVLHVIQETDPLSAQARLDDEQAMDAAVQRAKSVLGNRLSHHEAAGEPMDRIIEAASRGVDLIVMGTHGRVGRIHQMLGSVAEGVVRNAPCPVLTVREPSAGYQSFSERRLHRPTLVESRASTGGR